ncbi:hypothetical protein [Sphingomonas bacterium]|uniref:hypothetical protein n=1 Tax=Sphingomonas bacterium TaxID=1895847 RepID=UPI00262E380A|nr:hypothetical protein [Sphingomonas bacterium]MDB5677448.1 hypothetical protein [Sphingomonas bacterium]
MIRTASFLVGDAILFSALSVAWGWIVWTRLIANPVLRNGVSVTTGWITGGAIAIGVLMVTAVNSSWLSWHILTFFLTSYFPVLGAAILLGIYQRRKRLGAPAGMATYSNEL